VKKLKIWGLYNQDTAVALYRIIQPLQGIAKQKLAQVHHLPFFGQHADYLTSGEWRQYQALEGKWADVLFTTLASDQEYLALILALKDRYKLKLVVDVDDDILATHLEPNNPAFGAYTAPGDRYAEMAQYCIAQADLLVVSTPYLKKKFAPLNKNIVVVENCTDPELFKGENTPDEITIGYAGSASHQKDWEMIEPVLARMKEKYGVKIKVLGPMVTKIADFQEKWVDTLKYPEAVRSLGMSIGIAPLKDSVMNRGKSNLRWLEYSAFKVPTIASDVVPFRGVENIILVSELEEWEKELERLILSEKLRTNLGLRAYTESREKFSLEANAQNLFNSVASLFDGNLNLQISNSVSRVSTRKP
jgi:glycosyltransferase involved in cell wall biosynthesis